MSIRLRSVNGVLVALCAARSVPKPGDVYLDDGQHYALAEKFWREYQSLAPQMPECCAKVVAIVEVEESNNANRTAWDATFGGAA